MSDDIQQDRLKIESVTNRLAQLGELDPTKMLDIDEEVYNDFLAKTIYPNLENIRDTSDVVETLIKDSREHNPDEAPFGTNLMAQIAFRHGVQFGIMAERVLGPAPEGVEAPDGMLIVPMNEKQIEFWSEWIEKGEFDSSHCERLSRFVAEEGHVYIGDLKRIQFEIDRDRNVPVDPEGGPPEIVMDLISGLIGNLLSGEKPEKIMDAFASGLNLKKFDVTIDAIGSGKEPFKTKAMAVDAASVREGLAEMTPFSELLDAAKEKGWKLDIDVTEVGHPTT
jgi:hypothetical protein